MTTPNYHVIEFMVLPYHDINRYVIIPASWIQFRETDHVGVAYPEEEPTATDGRVRDNASYSETWKIYRARIVHTSDTYDGASNYINSQTHDNQSEQSDQLNDVITQLSQSSITEEPSAEPAVASASTSIEAGDVTEEPENQRDTVSTPRNKREMKYKYYGSPEHVTNKWRWVLRHPESGPGLVEIVPGSRVYINEDIFQAIQKTSTNYNELARRLLKAIFSDEALKVCSLTGGEATAFDYGEANVRPGLDPSALSVMLNFVYQFGQERGWGRPNEDAIKKSLINKLYEMRPKDE